MTVLAACSIAVIVSVTEGSLAGYHKTERRGVNNPSTLGLWGEDTREPLPDELAYLKPSIARLTSNDGRRISCTAFCVAPDVVATASHCVFSTDAMGRRPRLSSFSVEFNHTHGMTRAKIAGAENSSAQWNVIAGTTRFTSRAPLYNARDWALLKLSSQSCPAKRLNISPVQTKRELKEAILARRVFTVGYARRGSDVELLYAGDCETIENLALFEKSWSLVAKQFVDSGEIVLHRCAFGPGASGSPLFLASESGPVVIALNNGTIPVPAHILSGKSAEQRRALIRAMPEATNIAVSVNAFIEQLALMEKPTLQMPAEDTRRLQLFLRKSGYYKGSADGIYGVLMRQAILDYERRRQLPATGRPALALIEGAKPAP